MNKRYIITIMAANRVGILAAITKALYELKGNLLEVSQTVLQQFFTIILSAEFPTEHEPQVIIDHLNDIGRSFGLEINLKDPDRETLQPAPDQESEKFFLTATGSDKPGMIRELTARLSQESIDVTDLYARRESPSHRFVIVMELAVPTGIDTLMLKKDMEAIGEEVGLAVALQHENIFTVTNDPRPVRVAVEKIIAHHPE